MSYLHDYIFKNLKIKDELYTKCHKMETREELIQDLLAGDECDSNNGSY